MINLLKTYENDLTELADMDGFGMHEQVVDKIKRLFRRDNGEHATQGVWIFYRVLKCVREMTIVRPSQTEILSKDVNHIGVYGVHRMLTCNEILPR